MTLSDDVRDYWNTRAEGYSLHNCDELDGGTGLVLEHLFRTELGAKPGMLALDAGCGPGIFSIVLARLGCRVTGMDLSPEMLEYAGANAKSRGLEADFRLGDVTDPGMEPSSLDLIVSRCVLWNLPAPAEAYRRWMSLLKPGGRLLVIDGNHYLHLFDERYALWALRSAPAPGHAARYMRGVSSERIDRIARDLPLSCIERPAWDVEVLESLGAEVRVASEDRRTVATGGGEAQVTTNFCIVARKP